MPLQINLEKYIVFPFKGIGAKKPTFFESARKSIVKKRKGISKNLSRDIDKIVYGTK